MSNIADLRKEYQQAALDLDSVKENPIDQFDSWFEQALSGDILEPNAMVVSTSDASGQSTQRTVLLKAFDHKGFVFYTNYKSRKAKQIAANARVCLLFPWYALERQVIIQGTAEKVSQKESLKYFMSRPSGSRLGAWVSYQSQVITSRSVLEMKLAEMKRKFKDGEIPLPDFWGGFRVVPHTIEFWQGRPSRLHDRIEFVKKGDNWSAHRLSP